MEKLKPRNNPYVSVIIPAYNEEGNIEELCRQFDEMGQGVDFSFEVIIIDDGSFDDTGRILKEMVSRYNFVEVRDHHRNCGLTAALQTGFAAARGDVFVFYPADLQYKPEDIPQMIKKIDEGNDLVTGWKQGNYNKKLISQIYNYLSRKIFGLKVHDLNSVKAFRREVIENMFLRRDWHRYLVALAVEQGYRVDEVKVQVYPRHSGNSKFSGVARIPIGFLDMLAVKSQLTLLRKPLLFFGSIGLVLIGSGLVVGLVSLYLRFVMDIGLRPLLYLVILLMVLGMSFFILGFMAESLAALKEEMTAIRNSLQRRIAKENDSKEERNR